MPHRNDQPVRGVDRRIFEVTTCRNLTFHDSLFVIGLAQSKTFDLVSSPSSKNSSVAFELCCKNSVS